MRTSVVCLASMFSVASTQASLTGTATLAPSIIAGGTHYGASVSNTGTTTIGSFWFAWIPGQFYLNAVPTTISSPAGWTGQVVGGAGASSILWQANSAASYIPVGGTLSGFGFNSTDNTAFMSGNAVNFPSTPVTTSFFYSGAAFSDAGYRFVATVVPLPSATAGVAMLATLGLRRSRR